MRKSIAHIAVSVAILTTSCSGSHRSETGNVPRRKAYPRMEIADSVFIPGEGLPMQLQVNRAASATTSRSTIHDKWVDVIYPAYNASIHYTFTDVTPMTVNDVIDNRIERIALNMGGQSAEMISFTNPDLLEARIFLTPNGIATPVQFISTDNASVVVSGVAYLPAESKESADSLRPIADMLARDVIHSLKTIRK